MKLFKMIFLLGLLIYLFTPAYLRNELFFDPVNLLVIFIFFAAVLFTINRRIIYSGTSTKITVFLFVISFILHLVLNQTITFSTTLFLGYLLLFQFAIITERNKYNQRNELKKLRYKLRQFKTNKNEFSG